LLDKILSSFFKAKSQKCQDRLPTIKKENKMEARKAAVETYRSQTQQFTGHGLPSDPDLMEGFHEP
jgi:hypothetical protein